jgi:hypothetical protein
MAEHIYNHQSQKLKYIATWKRTVTDILMFCIVTGILMFCIETRRLLALPGHQLTTRNTKKLAAQQVHSEQTHVNNKQAD